MREFFYNEQRRLGLRLEAATWLGTPFFAHGKIKGAGVDCVQLAAQIYIATGFLDAFDPGPYTMDGGRHSPVSKVIAWIEVSEKFLKISEGRVPQAPEQIQQGLAERVPPMVGDLLCFKIMRNKVEWHVGVYVGDGLFIQALLNRVVSIGDLANLQAIRLAAIYRPMEVSA